ncbi:rhamnogalacturonan lyase [Paenibacillus humicola]|uniref:rhamnogalacturonan lyase n=1 Tax=Paenibacillus humicola TaxID=3110540 RepID=UPI00237B7027|nr:rhamnogalacturonan lyase [Paenibacillus humicola]
MEALGRGLIAVKTARGVYAGWRLLGGEADKGVAFNLYRDGIRVNAEPLTGATNLTDADGTLESVYRVCAVVDGAEMPPSAEAFVWEKPYHAVPLQKPDGSVTPDGIAYEYSANDAGVGDVDGDGEYEIVLKWDPSNSHDNAHDGYTGNVYLDCYRLDGTLLWRIDLGRNIRAGAHYTQFLVYDLDGDGRAELVCKTADGTTDGTGAVIGDADADYRNERGFIVEGPEYLTVFEGLTGRALATVPYVPPRGDIRAWGDGDGNRVDRFLACVAYLDGERPSIVMCRGYYTRSVLAAFDWRNGELTPRWVFDSDDGVHAAYAGQGNHSVSVADVDGDGCDEIVYGSCVVDHDGAGLYSTGLGHGDAMHVGKLVPGRPGLQVFQVHETPSASGIEMHDAGTGELLWGAPSKYDVGRGLCADIDPRFEGEECWAARKLFTAQGELISDTSIPSSVNFAIWWDGDLLRELLDRNRIDKWDYEGMRTVNLLTADGCASNNGTKATPCLQADLLGDWREEAVWRAEDSRELRIYTTTDETEHRIYTLMHDPVYRLSIAWQNVAYNQPPHPGFHLGVGMAEPPVPAIYTVPDTNLKERVNG